MKSIKIGMLALASLIMVSCGNVGHVMNGKALGNAVKSVIGLDKVRSQQLLGDWKFRGPGCAFTSENLLAKAGGEIAAVQIEEKALPYYQQVGISSDNTLSASRKTALSLQKWLVHPSAEDTLSTRQPRRSH